MNQSQFAVLEQGDDIFEQLVDLEHELVSVHHSQFAKLVVLLRGSVDRQESWTCHALVAAA